MSSVFTLQRIAILASLLSIVITYQHCGQSFEAQKNLGISQFSEGEVVDCTDGQCSTDNNVAPDTLDCVFDGEVVPNGGEVFAYQNSTGTFTGPGRCQVEIRTCTDGVLSGRYAFPECTAEARSCLFNGRNLASGESTQAYLRTDNIDGSVDCMAEERTCDDGILSGSYTLGACTEEAAKGTCLFDGRTYYHEQSVTAFLNSSVPHDGTCQQETRVCNDGTLSGSYNFGSCVVNQPKSCLFNSSTIAHGQKVIGFKNSSVAFGGTCESQERTCDDGALSGSFLYASCQVNGPLACLFDGKTVPHNGDTVAFSTSSVAFGETCQQETRDCNNGSLSGNYEFASCVIDQPPSCLINGLTIPHGSDIVAYQTSRVNYDQTCSQETRACNEGSLSGSYEFTTCEPDTPLTCILGATTVNHGEQVTAYQSASVPFGETCVSQNRTCTNGNLSGSYPAISCAPAPPANCNIGETNVNHGQQITAYRSASVPFGEVCESEVRSCTNGQLSGTFTATSCSTLPPASCTLAGQTFTHNERFDAFEKAYVPVGEECKKQPRRCNNGILTGRFKHFSCQVETGLPCFIGSTRVRDGESIETFEQTSVPYGGVCNKQVRTCTNGVLSSGFDNTSCTIDPGRKCEVDGLSYLGGSTQTFYKVALVPEGETCQGVSRTCQDGVMSGDPEYIAPSCETLKPASCLIEGQIFANDQEFTAYRKKFVAPGEKCSSTTNKCRNGRISASAPYLTCSVKSTGKSCTLDGVTFSHGTKHKFYQHNYTTSPTAEPRSLLVDCIDGVLDSTSYPYSSFKRLAYGNAHCAFADKIIREGQNITLKYNTGGECRDQKFLCVRGVLEQAYPDNSVVGNFVGNLGTNFSLTCDTPNENETRYYACMERKPASWKKTFCSTERVINSDVTCSSYDGNSCANAYTVSYNYTRYRVKNPFIKNDGTILPNDTTTRFDIKFHNYDHPLDCTFDGQTLRDNELVRIIGGDIQHTYSTTTTNFSTDYAFYKCSRGEMEKMYTAFSDGGSGRPDDYNTKTINLGKVEIRKDCEVSSPTLYNVEPYSRDPFTIPHGETRNITVKYYSPVKRSTDGLLPSWIQRDRLLPQLFDTCDEATVVCKEGHLLLPDGRPFSDLSGTNTHYKYDYNLRDDKKALRLLNNVSLIYSTEPKCPSE